MAKKPKPKIEIVHVDINVLRNAEYNPRMLTDKERSDIVHSIAEFGLVDPLIVNAHRTRKNVVIGGHQRLAIAKQLNFKTVPIVYVSLALAREKELNLRLNKNIGGWDFDKLAAIDDDLLSTVGFVDDEIAMLRDDIVMPDYTLEPEPSAKTDGVSFKFGDYSGVVPARVYTKFVSKYKQSNMEVIGDFLLEVLK